MSPRVPVPWLSLFLMLIVVVDVVAARVGLWLVAGYATAVAAAVLAVIALLKVGEALARRETARRDLDRRAAPAPVSSASRSRYVYPGIADDPAPRRSPAFRSAAGFSQRLPEILAFARGAAIIFLAVTTTLALRTAIALEFYR